MLIPWLRERLAAHVPAHAADHPDYAGAKPAAVLIPFVLRPDGPTLLLTERSAHLPTHAGQISFPGGRIEAGDGSVDAAALRESREEIGLDAARVTLVGQLGSYSTISGYRVTPVVGVVDPTGLALRPDPGEVASVFELPAWPLLQPSGYERRWIERRGVRGKSHFIECEGRTVWGATAGMLLMLAAALGIDGKPVDVD